MSEPAIEKTTMGHAVQMGLLTPEGEPVRVVDALRDCWIVWPASVDEPATVHMVEAEALYERDRQTQRQIEEVEE